MRYEPDSPGLDAACVNERQGAGLRRVSRSAGLRGRSSLPARERFETVLECAFETRADFECVFETLCPSYHVTLSLPYRRSSLRECAFESPMPLRYKFGVPVATPHDIAIRSGNYAAPGASLTRLCSHGSSAELFGKHAVPHRFTVTSADRHAMNRWLSWNAIRMEGITNLS